MSMQTDKVLTSEDEPIASALQALKKAKKSIKGITESYRPMMDGERYLTDKELADTLKVSRRTLQEYRTNRKIPYLVFGGKTLYREGDIQRMLERNYRKALK